MQLALSPADGNIGVVTPLPKYPDRSTRRAGPSD